MTARSKHANTSSNAGIDFLLERALTEHPWVFSLITTFLAYAFFWIIAPPNFTETFDDSVMASFLYGYMGEPESHLMYINILLGSVMHWLVQIIPFVPWYGLFQIVTVFLSMSVLVYLIARSLPTRSSLFAIAAIILTFGYQFLSKLQYSKTAGIAILAGTLLLFFALRNKSHFSMKLFALLLLFIGSLFRFPILFSLIAFLTAALVFELFDSNDGLKKTIAKFAPLVIVAVLLCVSGRLYQYASYNLDGEWGDDLALNQYRAELTDYGYPDYDANIELYQSLNISKNDLALYEAGGYGDTELFSPETIITLANAKTDSTMSLKSTLANLKKLLKGFLNYSFFPVLLVVIIWSLLCSWRNKRALAFAIIEILLFVLLQVYLVINGRYLQNRVDIVLALALCVILIVYCCRNDRIAEESKSACALLIAIVLFVSLPTLANEHQKFVVDKRNDPAAFFDAAGSNKSHFYFYFESWSKMPDKMYDAFQRNQQGSRSNIETLGTWRFNTPVVKEQLKSWGITNPYRALIDNDQVFLACADEKSCNLVVNHIREHYNDQASAVLVKTIAGKYRVYRIVTRDLELDTQSATRSNYLLDSSITTTVTKNGKQLVVSGWAFLEGSNSLSSDVYIGVTDENGNEQMYYAMQGELNDHDDIMYGRFGAFAATIPYRPELSRIITVYLKNNESIYAIPVTTS